MKIKVSFLFIVLTFSIVGQEIIRINEQTRKSLLMEHNKERILVKAASLRWNDTIAAFAQAWAMHLAKVDDIFHRDDSDGYGENIAYFYNDDITTGVRLWNEEKAIYKYKPIGDDFAATGHYTQVVWKYTKEVGCGCAKAKSGAYYLVCNYDPAGNWYGTTPY